MVAPAFLLGTPGQHVRAGDSSEFLGAGEPDKAAEVFQVILVRASGAWVVDIGEPFHRCRHAGQLLEFNGAQPTFTGRLQHGRGLGGREVGHRMPGPAGRPAACSAAIHSQYSRIKRMSSASGTRCCQRCCSSFSSWTPRSSSSSTAPAAANRWRARYQNPSDEVYWYSGTVGTWCAHHNCHSTPRPMPAPAAPAQFQARCYTADRPAD